jgi:hypothetical protein
MKRVIVAVGLALAANPAHAGLSLTAAGIADNFTLTTFFTEPAGGGNAYYDLSNAPLSDGALVGVNFQQSQLVKYSNVDGQTLGSAITQVSLPGVVNVATASGVTYASVLSGGYYSIAPNLAATPVSVPGVAAGYGLWANPVTGHLLAAGSGTGLFDIDPLTGISVPIGPNDFFDGVTVSPDGKTAYAYDANTGHILGFDISNLAAVTLVSDSGPLAGPPDGTGVISGGAFNGDIIVNANDGTVGLLDPSTNSYTIIASGGTRGDFASADPSGGTLFLAEFDATYRLGVQGGSIGSTTAPEPESLMLFGTALVSLGLTYRRRSRG